MRKTIIYSLTFIILGLGLGSLGPTLPALATQAHVEIHQISSLFVARSFGTILGSWLIGKWYDRVTGHPLLAMTLVAMALLMALLPSLTSLGAMIALFIFIGISYASINIGGNTLIVKVHGERVRPFMSAMHFAFGLGGLFAPLLFAKFAYRANSLQLTYWSLAILGLLPVALILLSPSPILEHHKEENRTNQSWAPAISLLALFLFLEVGAESCLMGWFFSYAVRVGTNLKTAGFVNSTFWAAFSLGRLATIWLSIRFSTIIIVITNLVFAILIGLGMILLPFDTALLWFGPIGLGLTIAPIVPNIYGYAQHTLGLTGKINGWFVIAASTGGMFWPWLVGQFITKIGPNAMPSITTIILSGALVIFMTLVAHTKTQETLVRKASNG